MLLRKPLTEVDVKKSYFFFSALALGVMGWFQHHTLIDPAELQTASVQTSTSAVASAPHPSEVRLSYIDGGSIPMPSDTPAAHASALLAMPSQHPAEMLAFWFAGKRESAPDVQIYYSAFDRHAQRWLPAQSVAERHDLAKQLGQGVRRIGNPVAWLDVDRRVHLFVVATGLGGWAASRIVHLKQIQQADSDVLADLHFEVVGMLPMSWLFNTSYLVRTGPVSLADGGMALPVYFEIGNKHPTMAWFGPKGEFRGLTHMTQRQTYLQPAVVAVTPTDWIGFLRDYDAQHIGVVSSQDAGRHWHDEPSLSLPNPNASVAVAKHGAWPVFFLAYNPSTQNREHLTLAMSNDAKSWHDVQLVEQGKTGEEYSYPALWVVENTLWLSYTDQRKRIAWRRYQIGAKS
jgi:predicted neuraminidase